MSQEILFLVEKCSHCISYYDIETGERLHSIPLLDFPHEFAIDSNEEFAYVGHYGVETSGHVGAGGSSILVIDIKKREWVRTIEAAPFNRLHGMVMDKHDRLYALSEEKGILLTFNDPTTANAPDLCVTSGGVKSHLFALSEDGEDAYCMNILSHTVSHVKPHDPLFQPRLLSPGKKPEGCCLMNSGKTLAVSNRISNGLCLIDTDTMTITKEVASHPDATRLYLSRDNELLVTYYGAKAVTVVNPETLEEIAFIPMEARPIALSLHPTKDLAFVSQDDNKVGIFNISERRFERFIETQLEPDVSRVLLV